RRAATCLRPSGIALRAGIAAHPWAATRPARSRSRLRLRTGLRSSRPPSATAGRSVFYRQRIERAPQVPGGHRAPWAPVLAQLAHPAEGDFSSLEVVDADPLLQAEVAERKHVGTQQVEHQEHFRRPAAD